MKAIITGQSGFIGGALAKRLIEDGWTVTEKLDQDADYMFLFGSPSSNEWFKPALSYSIRETIENFINAVDWCKEHKVKLIYPSSGTVYQGQTAYAKTKMILDILNDVYDQDMLGLRIFAGYGVGEQHKAQYASVIYQFVQAMKNGNTPEIWGDGKQTRDFVYIDDIVDSIIRCKDMVGTVDIGTGINTSFNQVIKIINQKLHTKIVPTYIDKPEQYVDETVCNNPCRVKVSLEEGIERIINE